MEEISSPTITGVTADAEEPAGYLHRSYAESLAEFGVPRRLAHSGAWMLEREIKGSNFRDAMGCYPIFCCRDWSQLRKDLEALSDELVSVTLVTDPFGNHDLESLKETFVDVVKPFKEHFVVDLSRPPETFVQDHHQRNARKALGSLTVEECAPAANFLDDWHGLYSVLVERHAIRGIAAFSRESFAKQLKVPGIKAFRAVRDGKTEGMLLWYVQGDKAYYHLGAYSERGYELRASFALFWRAVEHFADAGLRWLNLGAGAGLGGTADDGLSRFKRGWSTGTRTAYLCGRVFDRGRYDEITRARGFEQNAQYFPAYRTGELG